MGYQDRPGKSNGGPGISPNQALELTRRANEALSKASDLERRVAELEKSVNDKSQWNNVVRGWIGSTVCVHMVNKEHIVGVLKSVDRYTLYVLADFPEDETREVIIHKGSIVMLYQS